MHNVEMPRLQEMYKSVIAPNLKKKHGFKSVHAVACIKKITINMGVGAAVADKHALDKAVADLLAIAGQKPIITKARKSIAGFKIRQGWPIGCKVTLRKKQMYEFLDRLISIYLPRVRDFRGLSKKSFDGGGNYSLGLREQTVCPEIELDKVDVIRGFDITITTNATDDASAHELLKSFGFPIKE